MSLQPVATVRHDAKAWARRIVQRFEAGEPVGKAALEMARAALRQGGRG